MRRPFLNSKRLRYAWITGFLLWFGWLVSIALGSGNWDIAGQNIGNDFLGFYTGGKMLADGQSAMLYDLRIQHDVQQSILGIDWPDLFIYVNPPFYAWIFVPFALLPYRLSAMLWMGLGLVAVGLSVRLIYSTKPAHAIVWVLTFMPIFAAVSFGQNTPLSLLLLGLTYALWRRGWRFTAGWVSSLVLYKPQLLVGLGLLWLLEWRQERRTLAGLALGGGVLAGLSFGLMPEASSGFIRASRYLLSDFPPFHAYATRTFWLNLLPGVPLLPDALYFLCVAAGVGLFIHFWRRNSSDAALCFGGAICLTLWISPHVMIYEWSLLIIPAILLWERLPLEHERLKGIFALVWIAAFVSSPLTLAQGKILPFTLQVSVPVLGYALIRVFGLVNGKKDDAQSTTKPRVESPGYSAD